jgi:ankyrin repeat protein
MSPNLRPFFLALCLMLTACSDTHQTAAEPDEPAPLLSAAEQGDLPSIARLIADRPDVNVRDACLWTPLMKAALNGHLEAARQLIEAGAEVNLTDKGGYSALMLAASHNHADIIDLLLAAGADPNQIEQTGGFTALIWAAQLGHTAAVKRLLEASADPGVHDLDGHTAADLARQNGHREILDLLITRAADGQSRQEVH